MTLIRPKVSLERQIPTACLRQSQVNSKQVWICLGLALGLMGSLYDVGQPRLEGGGSLC